MGGKGGDDASGKAAKIADAYWDRARPVLGTYSKQAKDFMRGGYDPTETPMYQAGRNDIENQYDVARNNIIANMPSGGPLLSSLADLDTNRANMLTDLSGNIAQDEYNKAYGFATGAPQASMGTYSSLAGSQAAANAQENAGKFGAVGDIGGGLGMMYGMKGQGGGGGGTK